MGLEVFPLYLTNIFLSLKTLRIHITKIVLNYVNIDLLNKNIEKILSIHKLLAYVFIFILVLMLVKLYGVVLTSKLLISGLLSWKWLIC